MKTYGFAENPDEPGEYLHYDAENGIPWFNQLGVSPSDWGDYRPFTIDEISDPEELIYAIGAWIRPDGRAYPVGSEGHPEVASNIFRAWGREIAGPLSTPEFVKSIASAQTLLSKYGWAKIMCDSGELITSPNGITDAQKNFANKYTDKFLDELSIETVERNREICAANDRPNENVRIDNIDLRLAKRIARTEGMLPSQLRKAYFQAWRPGYHPGD